MRNVELLLLAWRNLMRRKSRTILTVISVVIGAVAIILMLSFGYGIEDSNRRQMEQFAQLNAIRVEPTSYQDPTNSQMGSREGYLRDEEIKKIKQIAHVKDALGMKYMSYEIVFKDPALSMFGEMAAIDFDALRKTQMEMKEGSLPRDTKKNPFIVGNAITVFRYNTKNFREMPKPVKDLDFTHQKVMLRSFDYGKSDDTPNNNIMIGNQDQAAKLPLTYAGTFSKSDLLVPRGIYISFDTLERMQKEEEKRSRGDNPNPDDPSATPTKRLTRGKKTRHYDNAIVTVDDISYTQQVIDEINDMQLNAYANSDSIRGQEEAMRVVRWIFAGIGSISLLISAIGIANTMLMSIHERTREIGVMKVIGAQIGDIRLIFLVESMLIGIIGGIIGVLFSYLFSFGINHFFAQSMLGDGYDIEQKISLIPFWLPFAAFGFSALIGLVAGYLPAKRATQISAIEAIRTE
ncbi:ABC transporter permease [Murdochiella massiliensis]|uniref:ABC transporter permease n=1 Tax=Murdochiella massiliensis TaxID=1673723 RepID=UPI00082F2FDB|nr:ABC transporter permease [Murdochiella massiliensis]